MGHAHGHGDQPEALTSRASQRLLFGIVGAVLVAALVGLLVLWPSGDREVLAEELGMGGDLVDATITGSDVGPCAGTDPDEGILCLDVAFEVTSGPTTGHEGTFQDSIDTPVLLDEGDRVVLLYQAEVAEPFRYAFHDFQRRTPLALLWGLFVLAVVALGRWKGVRALAALLATGVVMVAFLFPSILDGHDPTAVALVAAALIGVVALYLTHGVTEGTTVALLGTFAALGVTAILAGVFSSAVHFTGFVTEDAFYLQVVSTRVDIQGLVLAGIIIGSLGVLDDVTVTQVSAVWQLHAANPTYGVRRLYRAALGIGRDHIASTVNTLVLAYAGASLPLLLLFTQAGRSLGDVAVGELVAVEIVRTLVGSIGLITAVPITTGLAAVIVTRSSVVDVVRAQRPVDEGERGETELAEGQLGGAEIGEDELGEGDGWDRFAPREPDGW